MSEKWWTDSPTTTGHGIHSQYNPEAIRQWEERERRFPRRVPSPDRTLQQLRTLQQPPSTPGSFKTVEPLPPAVVAKQPLKAPTLPQYAHHHHFGWLPPTPERRIGGSFSQPVATQSGHAYSYGIANAHNQRIHNTHAAISTRKP
ncbi:hypothetical protein GPECTOR_1g585 [Gonium pectorale]|uniref:Uncharacterized protein n=1 Tax=Gonium pectorale TaxID=33097 RepID=A0A150H3B8_GONPE|nr:hypothetical protein GPECTOR_1g585 [Gonium pectorale]|eukprot:KXZ56649.1 hypothetical protein GPECTOR_1g585 [Gonium pectorale]